MSFKLRYTGQAAKPEFEKACSQTSYWYHTFAFDNGFVQHGDYDIAKDVHSYGFPEDMKGMSVLDVGTGSGWFSTYFEQRGAAVTTIDVRGLCDHDVFGRHEYPDVSQEKPGPDLTLPDGRRFYYSYASQGFWIMKNLLGLSADFINARVYDIRPELFGGKKFDLVFVGSLLMHLRDPIGALMACRSVTKDLLIATSWDLDSGHTRFHWTRSSEPLMQLMTDSAPVYWWRPNRSCLIRWFEGAGFRSVNVDKTVTLSADTEGRRPDALTAASHRQTLIHARPE